MGIIKRYIFGPASAAETSEDLKNKILDLAFLFSNQKNVAGALNFSATKEGEWERMVNEIYASGFVMVRLMLETITQTAEGKQKQFFAEIRDQLFRSYIKHLIGIGVEDKNINMWDKLLEMRRDEYWQERNEHRVSLPEPDKGNPWQYVVAIGGYHHIQTNDMSPDDAFFKLFLNWLGDLSSETVKILHSGVARL